MTEDIGRWTLPADTETVVLRAPESNLVINGADGQALVTIRPSGELEYGADYTPDEAARRFWDALRHLMPAPCPACGHIGMESP